MKNLCYIAAICLFAVIVVACNRVDKNRLTIPQMKFVIWDMMKADEWYTEMAQKDTSMERSNKKQFLVFYTQVFKAHDITREQFYNSYRYYEMHPAEMKILLDSMEQYSNRELSRISETHGQAKKK